MINLLITNSKTQKMEAWKIVESVYPDLAERIPHYEAYRQKLFTKARIVCAEDNGSLQGLIAFYCNDSESKTAYITQIAVKKCSQNMGIGGLLMAKCEEISRQNGMEHLRLEVRNDNMNAIRFYQKHGLQFEKKASEKSTYMLKSL